MSATYSIFHYKVISKVELEHFWFRARNHMIITLVNAFVPKNERRSFLEVGCGTGIVLDTMNTLGFSVTGLDVNGTALDYAKAKCPDAHLIRQSLYSYQTSRRFHAIGAFDVLEHQSNDTLFLKRCYELLEENGTLFLTVPAGAWLWSPLDVTSGHKRRYEREDLDDKLRKAGFHIVFSNYWSVLTLPWYILFRLYSVRKKSAGTIDGYLRIPERVFNTFLYYLLRLEQVFFLRYRFPFGATLVICVKK